MASSNLQALFRSPGNFPRRHFEYTNTDAPPSAQSLNSCCRQIEGENERIEEKKKIKLRRLLLYC